MSEKQIDHLRELIKGWRRELASLNGQKTECERKIQAARQQLVDLTAHHKIGQRIKRTNGEFEISNIVASSWASKDESYDVYARKVLPSGKLHKREQRLYFL